MSAGSNRRSDPGGMGAETVGLLLFVVPVVVGVGSVYAAVHIWHRIEGTAETLPAHRSRPCSGSSTAP